MSVFGHFFPGVTTYNVGKVSTVCKRCKYQEESLDKERQTLLPWWYGSGSGSYRIQSFWPRQIQIRESCFKSDLFDKIWINVLEICIYSGLLFQNFLLENLKNTWSLVWVLWCTELLISYERIQDVYPGSWILIFSITDPGSWFFPSQIPDLHQRIEVF